MKAASPVGEMPEGRIWNDEAPLSPGNQLLINGFFTDRIHPVLH